MTESGRRVVDASVVLSAILPEVHTQTALHALGLVDRVYAPDLLPYETISALCSRIARGDLSVDEADVKRLELRDMPVTLSSALDLDALAFTLANEMGHSAYDCFYLALAIEMECPLLTLDRRLSLAAESAGLGEYVELIA